MMRNTHSMSVRDCMPDVGELAHERGVADRLGEEPGDLEVQPVLRLEQGGVALEGHAVAGGQRLVEQPGDHPAGLVRVVDALAVERVHRSGGVADDRPGGADLRDHGPGHRDPPTGGGTARGLGRDAPVGRRRRGELGHEVGGVHLLPVAEGRQEADAHVHGPVADREDPAVAGERCPGPVPDVERALDPRIVVHRALEVAPDRHALGVGPVAGGAERPTEPRERPVGHDDVAGRHLPGGTRLLVLDHRATDEAVVQHRTDRLGALLDAGPGLHRPVGDHLVEVAPAHHEPMARVVGVLGPPELEGDAVRDRPQAVVAVVAVEPPRQAHVGELLDRPGREAVAAGLLAGEPLLLDDHHVVARLGQPEGRRRSGRPAADDEHVMAVGAHLVSVRMIASRPRRWRPRPVRGRARRSCR